VLAERSFLTTVYATAVEAAATAATTATAAVRAALDAAQDATALDATTARWTVDSGLLGQLLSFHSILHTGLIQFRQRLRRRRTRRGIQCV
jgi:hypothetical protein